MSALTPEEERKNLALNKLKAEIETYLERIRELGAKRNPTNDDKKSLEEYRRSLKQAQTESANIQSGLVKP